MKKRAHGQVRQSQVVTTWGPGALMDLPHDAAIVGGLDEWPRPQDLQEVVEPRLARKLALLTGVSAPKLYAPPADPDEPNAPPRGIGVWRFPEWYVVQERKDTQERVRSRRLVHRKALDEKGKFDGLRVVPTRFVRACPRGHIDDLDWRAFVHHGSSKCQRQLWLDERGTSGDLAELTVRCECGAKRGLYEASQVELNALGTCTGKRPWLGPDASEECSLPEQALGALCFECILSTSGKRAFHSRSRTGCGHSGRFALG